MKGLKKNVPFGFHKNGPGLEFAIKGLSTARLCTFDWKNHWNLGGSTLSGKIGKGGRWGSIFCRYRSIKSLGKKRINPEYGGLIIWARQSEQGEEGRSCVTFQETNW